MKSIDDIFSSQKILPIVQGNTLEDGVEVAKAMRGAGMSVVEVVLRNESALELTRTLKLEFPDLTVGVGTVYSETLLDKALVAGADFIVTPATTPKLLDALVTCGKPFLPGVSSLSDVAQMLEHDIKRMKLFPAEVVGGQSMLKAIGAVFRDVKFCPTGGVNAANISGYLALDNVFAAGGTWMVPGDALKQKDWNTITQTCEEAMALAAALAAS